MLWICSERTGRRLLTLAALACILFSTAVYAQSRVEYEIAFPNAAHHEAEITVTFIGAPAGRPLEVWMSRSSPGRYAIHEFAKNVYSVKADDGSGAPLTVTRPNPYQWNVSGHKGTVRVHYTLFADYASGTYTGIDNTHAHLNIPATFMWAKGMEQAPVRVTFKPLSNWKIATQLAPTDDPHVFTAPHMQYFMDSPTELSNFFLREWKVPHGSKSYTYRLAVHDTCTDKDVDAFTEMVKKVVVEQIAIFGEPAAYDYGTYTFIACYVPYVFGDGMEHRNSTSLTGTRSLSGGGRGNLGTVSHEFFHAWNVERLRPLGIEPFRFDQANMTEGLWLGEGFTQYYGGLTLKRAGFSDEINYVRGLAGTINAVVNSPARRYFSAIEMSMQAPFADGGVSTDPTNRINTYISYYTYGSAIAIGLELTLRSRFKLSLDDYMRALWQAYGKPEKAYSMTNLQSTLAKLTGDAAFAKEFFERYIAGREVVDYAKLLEPAGYILRPARAGKAWLDAQLRDQNGAVTVANATLVGGPLYVAGLDRGDRITSLDGQAVKASADVQRMINERKPGDKLQIEFEQRGEKKRAELVLTQDPQMEIVPFENAGREVTEEIKKFREQWLGTKVRQ
jgi:predicted metalloprotease with PDZ domain